MELMAHVRSCNSVVHCVRGLLHTCCTPDYATVITAFLADTVAWAMMAMGHNSEFCCYTCHGSNKLNNGIGPRTVKQTHEAFIKAAEEVLAEDDKMWLWTCARL